MSSSCSCTGCFVPGGGNHVMRLWNLEKADFRLKTFQGVRSPALYMSTIDMHLYVVA